MAFESLMNPHPDTLPDPVEAAEVTAALYKRLGFAADTSRTVAELTPAFADLTQLGRPGRLYAAAPFHISTYELAQKIPGGSPKCVRALARLCSLAKYELSLAQYDTRVRLDPEDIPTQPAARIALFNTVETGFDPTLHYLGLPYDKSQYQRQHAYASQTQCGAFDADKEAFEQQHPAFELVRSNLRDNLILTGMDEERGIRHSSEGFFMHRGWVRVPNPLDTDGSFQIHSNTTHLIKGAPSMYRNVGFGISVGVRAEDSGSEPAPATQSTHAKPHPDSPQQEPNMSYALDMFWR